MEGEIATRGLIQCAAGAFSDAGLEGEDDGHADEEEEAGKDEIGEGPAVPWSVVELRVDVGPVSGVVDEDHEGDGDAAESVDGENAGWSGCCGGAGPWNDCCRRVGSR